MKRVDCDGTYEICHRFASSEDIKLGALLDSPCVYPEDYPLTSEKAYEAVTCPDAHLPTVNDGFFNCSGYSVGDKCNLTCKDGYNPSSPKETVCEEYDGHKANWTVGNFHCSAVTCQNVDLPTVNAGFFNCSGFSVGDKCNLTCDDGYYPSSSKETVCKENVPFKANWTVGNFHCSALTCPDVHFATVNDGFFNCSGYSVGDKCKLTCDDGYYPSSPKETVCEEYDDYKANWTVGSFHCSAVTCQNVDLPTVNAGFFNCSGYSVGDKCNLTCDGGYYPSSSKETVCMENVHFKANWTVGNFHCSECNDWNEWNGSEYKHTSTLQTWEASHQSCESENSHLVTIENEEENDFVHKIVRHCSQKWTWIGLNDLYTENTWEWIDGTVSTYRNWGEGHPKLWFGGDCVLMYPDKGKWYNPGCTHSLYAVCERNNTLT